MFPQRNAYYLTIETRDCEVHPREILIAFAAASLRNPYAIESREVLEGGNWVEEVAHKVILEEFFPWAFVWAGNLHVGLSWEYVEFIGERSLPKYRRFEDFLNIVMMTYPCVNRAVSFEYGDTMMVGSATVYSMKSGSLTQVEDFNFGVGYDHLHDDKNASRLFPDAEHVFGELPHGDWPVDYIQGKYGIHTIHLDMPYDSYRTNLVDMEVLV